MKLEELNKRIILLEEEQRAQLTLAQNGQDDYAWKKYKQITEHLRTLRSQRVNGFVP
jgi:hypothetical protein